MHTSWHSPHPLQGFCCAFLASSESVIPLLANELKNDRALTRPGIEVDQNYLLAASGHQLAVSKRNSQGRLQQRRAKMTGAVVVAPSCMMEIIALLGNQSLEKFMDVANKSGLEFDCGYASSVSTAEEAEQKGKTSHKWWYAVSTLTGQALHEYRTSSVPRTWIKQYRRSGREIAWPPINQRRSQIPRSRK